MFRNPTWLDLAFIAAILAITAVQIARDRRSSPQTPVESLQERFAAGEIDTTEFERELEFVVDDRNQQIRAIVEDANGVGTATSKAIAREYDSIADLRQTDRDRLEAIHGVGPSTAESILERVQK